MQFLFEQLGQNSGLQQSSSPCPLTHTHTHTHTCGYPTSTQHTSATHTHTHTHTPYLSGVEVALRVEALAAGEVEEGDVDALPGARLEDPGAGGGAAAAARRHPRGEVPRPGAHPQVVRRATHGTLTGHD